MKYYYQEITESGSFAYPMPDDYSTCEGMDGLRRAFDRWLDTVRQYSDEPVSLVVFKGEPDTECLYPCDDCPDFIIESGPRDGMIINRSV